MDKEHIDKIIEDNIKSATQTTPEKQKQIKDFSEGLDRLCRKPNMALLVVKQMLGKELHEKLVVTILSGILMAQMDNPDTMMAVIRALEKDVSELDKLVTKGD